MNAVLTFQNTTFDVVDIHNVPWLRGPQIGGALGYADPSDSVQKIYSRNADEFTDEMTQVLDLPTAGGVQQVRVFSPRGCHLLAMLARTPIAKAFRQWVLDVLEGRAVSRQDRPITIGQQTQLVKLRDSLAEKLQRTTEAGLRTVRHQNLRYVSRLLGEATPPLDSIGRTVDQPGLPGV